MVTTFLIVFTIKKKPPCVENRAVLKIKIVQAKQLKLLPYLRINIIIKICQLSGDRTVPLFFAQKTYEGGAFNKLCFLNVNRQFNGAMVRT